MQAQCSPPGHTTTILNTITNTTTNSTTNTATNTIITITTPKQKPKRLAASPPCRGGPAPVPQTLFQPSVRAW
ncbi:MAG: hypothetical protein WB341_10410 [Terracidiphilus sp.]